MSQEIPLTRGQVAVIDDEDFARVSVRSWQAAPWNGKFRARSTTKRSGQPICIHLSRFIMDAPAGVEVDHINGDPLDNRRKNLRLCTSSQNKAACGPSRVNTSGFKGVSWSKSKLKWVAMIQRAGRGKFLGHFSSPEEAARAYDKAALALSGEFAYLNFPPHAEAA